MANRILFQPLMPEGLDRKLVLTKSVPLPDRLYKKIVRFGKKGQPTTVQIPAYSRNEAIAVLGDILTPRQMKDLMRNRKTGMRLHLSAAQTKLLWAPLAEKKKFMLPPGALTSGFPVRKNNLAYLQETSPAYYNELLANNMESVKERRTAHPYAVYGQIPANQRAKFDFGKLTAADKRAAVALYNKVKKMKNPPFWVSGVKPPAKPRRRRKQPAKKKKSSRVSPMQIVVKKGKGWNNRYARMMKQRLSRGGAYFDRFVRYGYM